MVTTIGNSATVGVTLSTPSQDPLHVTATGYVTNTATLGRERLHTTMALAPALSVYRARMAAR